MTIIKGYKIYFHGLILCCFFAACNTNQNARPSSAGSMARNERQIEDLTVMKFNLPFPDDFLLDSNGLIFYSSRSFDTSSLIHIQENNSKIRGVYYEMLPTYHQFVNDFADEESNLLFFEGYSFVIDSAIWQNIKAQAERILRQKDTIKQRKKFVDGSKYALYHNAQSRRGDSNDEAIYEEFNRFLKNRLLDSFIVARKPQVRRK